MCNPASGWATRDRIYWGTRSESHTDIATEHGLHIDGVRGANAAKFELVPPVGPDGRPDYTAALAQWTFRLDEDVAPKWCDVAEIETRAREALPQWVAAKIVLPGQVRESVREGDHVIAVYGTIESVGGSAVIESVWGSAVITHACIPIPRSVLKSPNAVLIDRSGDKALCYVGKAPK